MIVNSLGVVRLSAHITFLFVRPSPNGNTHFQISNHIKLRKKEGIEVPFIMSTTSSLEAQKK